MNANEGRVTIFNKLLRGEISAAETYRQALDKLGNEAAGADLKRIHVEHREAANDIRKHIHDLGGKPDQDSGAWGAFAKAVEGTAKVFGNAAAIKALKEGEEQGISDYEKALQQSELGSTCRTLVSRLLTQTRSHTAPLDRLLSA